MVIQHIFILEVNGDSFRVIDVKCPSFCESVHGASYVGLTDEEADTLIDLIGHNRVPFDPPGWMPLLLQELSQFFYLYQLATYTIWFWFSYLVVGAALALVVLLSATAKVIVAHTNLHALAKLARVTAQVWVRRHTQINTQMDNIYDDGWTLN
eukprot:GHVR01138332.1.p2 GENE.GHVR01138332.1~~GHVR01138332.1.p2  ORF type:complete len:153 (+),score=23.43 GHVR01138332.1:842-1300(+)